MTTISSMICFMSDVPRRRRANAGLPPGAIAHPLVEALGEGLQAKERSKDSAAFAD
jgi:hypothetical protein